MTHKRRGFSLAISLLVLVVLVVLAMATGTVGVQGLYLANADRSSRASFYTAEGALAHAVQRADAAAPVEGQILEGQRLSGWAGAYSATVTNNLSSRRAAQDASRVRVPALHALIRATGLAEGAAHQATVVALARSEREFYD